MIGTLTYLNMDHNPLGDMGALALATLFQKPELNNITHLRAAECEIEDGGT